MIVIFRREEVFDWGWARGTGVNGWDWLWIGLGLLLGIMKWGQIYGNRQGVPGYGGRAV